MTRKYNIQLNDLIQLRDLLYAYTADETVRADIETLNMAIARFENNFEVKDTKDLIEKICLNLGSWEDYTKLFSYVSKFSKSGMAINPSYSPKYNSILLTDDETVDLCRDFYTEQGPFFSEMLEEFCEDKYSRLHFFEPNKNSEGEIHFIESTGDAFVFSPNYQNIKKPSVLTHEFEHVIDSFNNPKYYRNKVIREIGSTFMEMIGCNHLARVLDLGDDGVKRRAQIHTIVKSTADFLVDKMTALHFINGLRDQSVKEVLRKTSAKLKHKKKYIQYMFDTNLVEDYYYQISYLIAIELYEIYNVDKDRALYILIDIITNGNDNNIFEILNKYNIVLNSNVCKYEDDMCLKLGIKKED